VIGCLFDSDAGTISCFRNRAPIGLMYQNIRETVFPAVHVNVNAALTMLPDAVQPF